ncbi:SRPBCC domain-containing protein [Pseudoflavitalea sp. G-6-1-2]|uniref:SRPBCC family protein n=1 Tax=Pseudoflavitalea sp. G-6-1-2 TaxID=2728841 RepID=UPI00146D8B9D|nr:SRPBCC domain-containing protein [Pseudoflavitalea sp. G-6-1-2]NML21683.1 SRPBCC domain-containing protein [Pseudoflavitalea sp. G-6-1-2]
MSSNLSISEQVIIDAMPAKVWRTLTVPESMIRWMGDPEMAISIQTSWELNTPIEISGHHHGKFVNYGTILAFEPDKQLSYSHLSSSSRLPHLPENFCILHFTLHQQDGKTLLSLHIGNFQNDIIFKHLRFYWRTALVKIKRQVESEVDV